MKKITDIEERKELKKEGIFLEGMFWAKYGNSNDVMVIMILVIATALMSFYQFHAEWMDDHTYVLMLLSLLWVGIVTTLCEENESLFCVPKAKKENGPQHW